ncbi:SNF2 family N-terminal domain-containing protein [Lipomyces orientalis]|uniref:SNF2 family N-terminal domain-containing protein n=1 Tax=Lipomyces orientalis TaxID=1233043 RepID=A0ACC3TQB0_9ASCO
MPADPFEPVLKRHRTVDVDAAGLHAPPEKKVARDEIEPIALSSSPSSPGSRNTGPESRATNGWNRSNGRPVSSDSFYGSLSKGINSSSNATSQRNFNDGRPGLNDLPRTTFSSASGSQANNPFPLLFNSSSNNSRTNSTPSLLGRNASGHANETSDKKQELSPSARMRSILDKFAYKSHGGAAHSSLAGSRSNGQPLSTNGTSSNGLAEPRKVQAVTKLVQRRPAPARPVVVELESPDPSITPEERKLIARLQITFPTVSSSALLSAVRLKGSYDGAAEWLAQQDELHIGGVTPGTKQVSRTPSPTTSPILATSKRDITKPAKSIREKFSAAQVKNAISLSSPTASSPVTIVESREKYGKSKKISDDDDEEVEEIVELDDVDSDMSVEEYGDSADLDDRLLKIFNSDSTAVIADVACCSEELAQVIVANRPYSTLDSVRTVDIVRDNADFSKPKKSRRPRKAAGDKAVDTAIETLSGYEAVDSLISKCEQLGNSVSEAMAKWGVDVRGSNGELEIVDIGEDSDSSDSDIQKPNVVPGGGYFTAQPSLLATGVELKSYQQVGINWLNLLYRKKLSCILADEMGLGKTCQVIAFLAHLKEIGREGPHLVVVPSSTLENWLREFKRFCPSFVVEPYYGLQKDRAELRAMLSDPETHFDVIVTTYNLACGSPLDCSFLRSFKFNTCVYDEGHLLKNSESERYQKLMRLKAEFRLLLTGTPLQNNLQELISLLAFILPHLFKERKEDLAGIFKHKAKTTTNSDDASNLALLSQQRISRAKTMMTPFVLRRKKDQVLQHLPKKHHRVEYCELSAEQKAIYDEEVESSRHSIEARESGNVTTKAERSSSNVLMRLRKAAVHPLLFRKYYDEVKLRKMARDIMKEERYFDANEQYIFEDMEVMSDFELHNLCIKFRSINQYRLQNDEWMNSGKVEKLSKMLVEMKANGDRILIFSQFTQTLDILESVLSTLDVSFLRLDGQTPVEVRQDLIDKFYDEEDITCFLLSTKAGGFGVNLACANVVIIFDMSFNPHDDRQAEDRAHRVGQTREVKVVRLVTKGTIEEAILQLANTKLALDKSVSDESDEAKMEEKNAELVEKMIFKR